MGLDGELGKLVVRLAALSLAATVAATPASACGVELVLAMDVSRSVVNAEFNLQMGGLAQAFRTPEIVEAIGWIPGGVMATVTQWSGPETHVQSTAWRHLESPDSIAAFAAEIDAVRRQFFAAFTAVGEALIHADALSATNPRPCQRRVIDVSGDGASNRGREPRPIAAALAAEGVTVNALVIKGARPDPEAYYAENVIAGPGAFVITADSFNDYARAIREKLLRELSPAFANR